MNRGLLFTSRRYWSDSTFANEATRVTKSLDTRRKKFADTRIKLREVRPRNNASNQYEPFPFEVTESNKTETLRNIISPMWIKSYEDQLILKTSYCKKGLRTLTQQLYRIGTPVRQNVNRLPCNFYPIVPSPNLRNFRGSHEFSIGPGIDRQTLTVGYSAFPVSKHGERIILEPEEGFGMSSETHKLTKILQNFVRVGKKLPICFRLGHEGGWTKFATKNNSLGELMLIGVVSPTETKVKDLLSERENFKEFMIEQARECEVNLASVYFQACPHNRCPHSQSPYELIHGQKTLVEKINGYEFAFSPESQLTNLFVLGQLNEVVKKTINECFSFKEKPVIIDSHCGVGIMSLDLSDHASRVVGIDKNILSVEDAKHNAERNNVENCEFLYADINLVMNKVLDKVSHNNDDILMVCYPPKSGLNRFTTDVIRQCSSVKKMIFIAIDSGAPTIINTLMRLCQKEQGRESTKPFVPMLATPVDILPYTDACGLVIALERL